MRRLALVIAAVLFAASTDAGVIEWSGSQNIEMGPGPGPGWQGIGNTYIDFDNDGLTDCRLAFTYDMDFVSIPQLGPDDILNGITAEDQGLGPKCWPLDEGTAVGEVLPGDIIWDTEEEALIEWRINGMGEPQGVGPWYATTNGYMGVSFDAVDGIHYGWVRMTVAGEYPGAIVHDWAWNTTPDEGLWAGQVPEPSTCMLFIYGGLTVIAAIRQRRSPKRSCHL